MLLTWPVNCTAQGQCNTLKSKEKRKEKKICFTLHRANAFHRAWPVTYTVHGWTKSHMVGE